MINVLRRENEAKQAAIIVQLEAKEELNSRVNRELEAKVSERKNLIESQRKIIETEKVKTEELLHNILPVSIANELKINGYSDPKYYENVGVLFTDFVDFTVISANCTAEKLVAHLDYCFKAFDDIIVKHVRENRDKTLSLTDAIVLRFF